MNAKLPLLLCWPLLALAACGPSPARVPAARPPAVSPPAASPVASPEPTAAPAPSPAPTPLPDVVVVRSPNRMVAAVTTDGTALWAFDPASLGIGDLTLVTGGADVFAYAGGHVAVIDRTGTVVGRGTYAGDNQVFPAPSGRRWAWTSLDQSNETSNPPHNVSSLWVAGIGEAPHKVKTWSAGFQAIARQWSDAGIVVAEVRVTCGRQPVGALLVDPATGAGTPLFGDGLWPLDVHAGVHVATDINLHTLHVAGAAQLTRDYPILIQQAGVSPSGNRLFVTTFDEEGCGGRAVAATSVVELPSTDQSTLDGFFGDAWLDDTHLLGRTLVVGPDPAPQGPFSWSQHVQVADLAGHRSDLALGTLIGVLRP